MTDKLQRFYFSNHPIRGAAVQLSRSYAETLEDRNYPDIVKQLLAQALAATTLLASNLKNDARISLQAQGDTCISLLMAECDSRTPNSERTLSLRAVARYEAVENSDTATTASRSLAGLLGDARLAITIEPENGQRYQGIVTLRHTELSACLQDYFEQSEQLPTQILLFADEQRAGGLLLQQMPEETGEFEGENRGKWEELTALAATITTGEVLGLEIGEWLHRLFHQQALAGVTEIPVRFGCSCSRQRTLETILRLDPEWARNTLEQDSEITVDCEFCSTRYRFERGDLDKAQAPPGRQH